LPNCPYCLEDIKPGARKCPHCQSSLETSADSGRDTVYILDKGLIRFGKFVAAALGLFLIMGAYFFGIDLKDALKQASEAVKETSTAEIQVENGLLSAEKQKAALDAKIVEINNSIEQMTAMQRDIERLHDQTQTSANEVRELVAFISSQKDVAAQLIFEIKSLNPTQAQVASAKREERGIQGGLTKLWRSGSTVRFYFLDGSDKLKTIVRAAINEWAEQVNLHIVEAESNDAEIRISFKDDSGSWSFTGTDVLGIPHDQPTINYGTLEQILRVDGQAIAMQTALHEFGHALGLVHEFQNPLAGDIFDSQAVYRFYTGPPNFWSKDDIDRNLLTKAKNYPGSRPYDPESVMNYSFKGLQITNPGKEPRPGAHLSESDKLYVASLYPRS
jgi:hypothetical protein